MKKSRYTDHQIINILKEAEAGKATKDICREYGISASTFYNWKAKYGGMESSDVKRLRELEEEKLKWVGYVSKLAFGYPGDPGGDY